MIYQDELSFAPASKTILTILFAVVPLTIESSIKITFLFSIQDLLTLCFNLTPNCLIDCDGSIKVLPT